MEAAVEQPDMGWPDIGWPADALVADAGAPCIPEAGEWLEHAFAHRLWKHELDQR